MKHVPHIIGTSLVGGRAAAPTRQQTCSLYLHNTFGTLRAYSQQNRLNAQISPFSFVARPPPIGSCPILQQNVSLQHKHSPSPEHPTHSGDVNNVLVQQKHAEKKMRSF